MYNSSTVGRLLVIACAVFDAFWLAIGRVVVARKPITQISMTARQNKLNRRDRGLNQTDQLGQIERRYFWRRDAIF